MAAKKLEQLMRALVLALQLLMTETLKTKFDLNPPLVKDMFKERGITCNLRHDNDAQLPKVRTTSFGVETLPYLENGLCCCHTT